MIRCGNLVKRVERLEVDQRAGTIVADMDRYLTFVADVDGLTPLEVQELRTNAMAAVADPRRQPATDAELCHIASQIDAMVAWEQEAMRR